MKVKAWWALALVLHGSIFAGFVVFVLWNSGHFRKSEPAADPVAQVSGTLPVVPVLRVYDPVRERLREDLRAGRAVCAGGYYARPAATPEGYAYVVQIRVGDQLVPCP